MATTAEFVQLDELNPQVVEDFVPLLSQLSQTFAQKDGDVQRAAIERNLGNALESPDAFVMVHRDADSDRIVSTATGSVVHIAQGGTEGWVDDVVTLKNARGKGLGRQSMDVLHTRFADLGTNIVRLTSSFDRAVAGNLYEAMGYVEAGTVWRAPLNEETTHYAPLGNAANFIPVNCTIPTGNKAWVYGPYEPLRSATDMQLSLERAGSRLLEDGIESANYFTVSQPNESLARALISASYDQRETRLYTLDLQ